jgi:hypothetical protein
MQTYSIKLMAIGMCISLRATTAWGPVGHEVVAYIAESKLTDKARQNIEKILPRGEDLASVANWADVTRTPTTAPWHFIDIEDRQQVSEADEARFCPNGDCVVEQINKDISVLKDTHASSTAREDALRYLVHFVGDLHQPLHCADDTDRGGNNKIVIYKDPQVRGKKGTKIKLHALWDRLVEVKTAESSVVLASDLEREITPQQEQEWVKGKPEDWAWEAFTIAHDKIYPDFQPGGVPLPATYYSGEMRTIVDEQLERAGVRLAHVLNEIFGM